MNESTKPFEMTAGNARIHLREALDQVRRGVHVHITRWSKTDAVMVSPAWHARAVELMASAAQDE